MNAEVVYLIIVFDYNTGGKYDFVTSIFREKMDLA